LIQRGGGAVVPFNVSSLPLRLENSIVAATAYLIQTVWPERMAVFYPMPAEIPVWQWASAACFLAAASAFAVREIKRRPWLAVGWFWYLVTLVPVIGIVQVGAQSRADRYTYIPMVGIAIIAAWGAGELLGRAPRVLAAALGTAAIVAFCVVTIHQLAYWQNSTTLFEHAIAVTRNNYVAYNNLGLALRAQGRLDEALSNYRRAAAIEHQLDRGPAWVNLSEALLARGSVKEAAEAGREAAKVAPGSALAHIVLGASLRRMGDLSGAEREYRTAIALESASAPAHTGLGLVLEAGGMKTEAQGEFDVAIALDPDYVPAHFNLGRLYGAAGRPEEAAAQFREAVRLEPGDAETHFNLGTALAAMDKLPEAEAEFTEAIRLRPAYASAHFNLATALANSERLNEAIAHFSEAVRIDPAFKEAQESLEYARFLRDRTTAGGKK
jgi:tetratricopeptide (TPR) repeat protein